MGDMMDQIESRQQQVGQWMAVFLIVFGSGMLTLACWKGYAELKTASAGIIGVGSNMITSQIRQYLTNRSGGTINVGTAPPDTMLPPVTS